MTSGLRIEIDPETCIGSGNCGFWAPTTFDIGDDNIAFVVDPEGDEETLVRKAAAGCPTRSITLTPG
ncbi:MAG: ferredoxin [Acidimicrobiales bacterium]